MRYFIMHEEFEKANPILGAIQWRLYQSIATKFYFRNLENLC
ncbi:hypothetical protein [Gilliamella sp. wkB18]